MASARIGVGIEAGRQRTFATALDWPGWARSAKGGDAAAADAAVAELEAYRDRYARVVARVDLAVPARPVFDVLQTVPGDATTDFGAPSGVFDAQRAATTTRAAQRRVALLDAAWAELDEVASTASATLRKGPRGGGRDRDAVVQHVLNAEASYARKAGVRHRDPQFGDDDAVAALRDDLRVALGTSSPAFPDGGSGWPAAYVAARIAWHVLDHAWEIEDKSG